MNLIDTHAHLTYEGLAERLDDVLARSIDAGVTRWITVGTKIADNEDTLLLISRHDNLWGALGYHPHEADDVTDADMELLKKQLGHARVVAIGETGLDYHYLHSTAENQQRVFRQHLVIAAEVQ
ncbi:MAG: TatD family hydrolase, partial [Planctomycetota bacterium]